MAPYPVYAPQIEHPAPFWLSDLLWEWHESGVAGASIGCSGRQRAYQGQQRCYVLPRQGPSHASFLHLGGFLQLEKNAMDFTSSRGSPTGGNPGGLPAQATTIAQQGHSIENPQTATNNSRAQVQTVTCDRGWRVTAAGTTFIGAIAPGYKCPG